MFHQWVILEISLEAGVSRKEYLEIGEPFADNVVSILICVR